MLRGQTPSDADLVRAAQNGDTVSLGLLLERYRTSLYALALRILGYGPQAEDAVQDAFVVALRKIDHVREPAAVGGWLHAVLRNVCLMRLRTGQGELLFKELPMRTERGFSEPSAEESIDQLAMREWVWTALSELPEVLRVTAMLRYFGSYSSYEEVSAILGVPIGTVRSRLNQVKTKLADALLKTAGLEHNEARRLTESRARYFREVMEGYNGGQADEEYVSGFAEDVVGVLSNGTVFCGRELVAEDLEGDMEAGMKLHLTNVMASRDITIIEGDFQNPPDNPFRCPPATTQVHFHHGGVTHRVHLHFAPRSRKEES